MLWFIQKSLAQEHSSANFPGNNSPRALDFTNGAQATNIDAHPATKIMKQMTTYSDVNIWFEPNGAKTFIPRHEQQVWHLDLLAMA
jgi:hypothetical protein